MTDSIEMAINEYGAYPIRQQEASSGFDANYHGNNNTHNVCNEEKEESAVHSSKINSSNNSFVVSQESSSEGMILSEVQSISIFFASEGRNGCIWPGVEVRPIVRAVKDDRVVGDTQLVKLIE